MAMQEWEKRFDAIVVHAWETWTKNGLGLDQDEHGQTVKTIQDAATNAWLAGMDDNEWLTATLSRLGA